MPHQLANLIRCPFRRIHATLPPLVSQWGEGIPMDGVPDLPPPRSSNTVNGTSHVEQPQRQSEAERLLTSLPFTLGYRPTQPLLSPGSGGDGWGIYGGLVPSWDIERMLVHPAISAPYSCYKAGISSVSFDVKDAHPKVADFVHKTLTMVWERHLTQLQGCYDYGWQGYEPTYRVESGIMHLASLHDFNPMDCWALTKNRLYAGFEVQNVEGGRGSVGLWGAGKWPAKGIWLSHNKRHSRFYGRSQLLGAWEPWRYLTGRDGAMEATAGGVFRFAYSGPLVRFPDKGYAKGGPGGQLDYNAARNAAREIYENVKAGAGVALPSSVDEKGNMLWDIVWPEHVLDAGPLIAWIEFLQKMMSLGVGTPPELLEASDTGSGWSGRKIPMLGFFSTQLANARNLVWQLKQQLLDPLVRWNFGTQHVSYTVEVKLVLPPELSGDQQKPGEGGGAGGTPKPGEAGQKQPDAGGLLGNQPGAGAQAAPPNPQEQPGAAMLATEHSPAGGITIAGHLYPGGEFIPAGVVENATPEQKKVLEGKASEASKPSKSVVKSKKEKKPSRAAVKVGEAVSARLEGTGKNQRVVLADGSPAPPHIKPAMIGKDWENVHVYLDPESDVRATGTRKNPKTGKVATKTTYRPEFAERNAGIKWARTAEGLEKAPEMQAEIQRDRQNPARREDADCAWLMSVQATRPGGEADTKGLEKYYGRPMTPDMVNIVPQKGGKSYAQITVDGKKILLKDKGAVEQLAAGKASGQMYDTTYWLKSYGATTLEGRHVHVGNDGTVSLRFMGKESVWHDHTVRDRDLAEMLKARKEAAGNDGKLFSTTNGKVSKYTGQLDSGKFSPKDFRTTRANQLAIDAINSTPQPKSAKEYKKAVLDVGEKVSRVLGNDRAMALASYIMPANFAGWKASLDGGANPEVSELATDWDESEHKRDHGKFAKMAGAKAEAGAKADAGAGAAVKARKGTEGDPAAAHKIVGNPTDEHKATADRFVKAAPGLSEARAKEYGEHLAHALSVLPPGISRLTLESINHAQGGVKLHENLKALRAAAESIDGKKAAGVVGFVNDRGLGTDVHLDGGDDPRGTYVHELWHAADRNSIYSDDKEWQAAYKKDVLKAKFYKLSTYAMENPSEGFAEFGRVLAERGIATMTERFPNLVKHLKNKGLI